MSGVRIMLMAARQFASFVCGCVCVYVCVRVWVGVHACTFSLSFSFSIFFFLFLTVCVRAGVHISSEFFKLILMTFSNIFFCIYICLFLLYV